MKGKTIAEQMHVVNALEPVDIGGAAKTSDYINLKNAAHITFIVQFGVITNAPTVQIKKAKSDGGSLTAIAFDYYQETTADGDTLADRATATTAGVTLSTDNNQMLVIEIDAAELEEGYDWIALVTDNAAACLISAVAVLSGYRYQKENTPTAIA
jgi:hypothetical protein